MNDIENVENIENVRNIENIEEAESLELTIKNTQKAISVMRNAMQIACAEQSMASGGCEDCPLYNSMRGVSPCDLDFYARPFLFQLEEYFGLRKKEN